MDAKELFRRIGENVSVGRAFGPAYEVGGTTIVPVAVVAGGGGGGEGSGPTAKRADGQTGGADGAEGAEAGGHASGSGGGYGGFIYPLGVYVVRSEGARFVPCFDVTRLAAGALLLFRLIAKRARDR
ncbi:MAG TPA: hypothetical protein VMR97_08885 [Acidimicrobiales bacterium]|nr:hypothetical protein [Acidimicrobiales bacterium]